MLKNIFNFFFGQNNEASVDENIPCRETFCLKFPNYECKNTSNCNEIKFKKKFNSDKIKKICCKKRKTCQQFKCSKGYIINNENKNVFILSNLGRKDNHKTCCTKISNNNSFIEEEFEEDFEEEFEDDLEEENTTIENFSNVTTNNDNINYLILLLLIIFILISKKNF